MLLQTAGQLQEKSHQYILPQQRHAVLRIQMHIKNRDVDGDLVMDQQGQC